MVYLHYALEEDEDITAYAESYCEYLTTGVAAKIAMIDALATLDPTSTDYADECYTELMSTTNYWFDPVIPSEFILVGDMCQAYQDLFIELEDRNITAFDD
jgi:hypothetical protein